MVRQKSVVRRVFSLFVTGLLFVSLFSFGAYAAEGDSADTSAFSITFDSEIAGTLGPISPFYFLDFTHTPEEYIHEAGLAAQEGNVAAAQKALDRFAAEVADSKNQVEARIYDEVTLEGLSSHEGVQYLYDTQVTLLDYDRYVNQISLILEEQVASGTVDETAAEEATQNAEAGIAEVGAVVEEQRQEVLVEVRGNSGVSRFEVERVLETGFVDTAERRFPGNGFEEIGRIQEVEELKSKITEIRQRIVSLEESGDSEELTAARQLLELAFSHGTECLKVEKEGLEITGFLHLTEAEKLAGDAEQLLDGEVEVDELAAEGVPVEIFTAEEIQEQLNEEEEIAIEFVDRYDELKEQYADDAEGLALLDAENLRAQKIQELDKQLYENGVMERWTEQLRLEGKSEEEIQAKLNDKFSDEWNAIYYNGYFPLGLYDAKEDIQADVSIYQDPQTGKVGGWYDGKSVPVEVGGGFVQDYIYADPQTGYTYTYGSLGYSYTTPAGIVHSVAYAVPEGVDAFTPVNQFNAGDEVYSYPTEDGGKATYTSTGYYHTDAEGNVVVEEAYDLADKYVYLGSAKTRGFGGTLDVEVIGVIVTNTEGEATVWEATPEFTPVGDEGVENKAVTYYDPVDGKVFTDDVSPHEAVEYKEGSTYEYEQGGVKWTYDSIEKTWTNPSGTVLKTTGAPAPVGFQGQGEVRTSEGTWTYDSVSNSWTSPGGAQVHPSPSMGYSYDTNRGGFWDAQGGFHASEDRSVTDPYTGSRWSYQEGTWRTSQGDAYDPKTGTVTRADGSVASPGSEGAYYGYSQDSSGQRNAYQYAGYGGYQTFNPATQSYAYVNPGNYYYGGFNPGQSQIDASGNSWTMRSDGTWANEGGGYATAVGGIYSGTGIGSTPSVPAGTTYSGPDGKTYTKSAAGDWVSSTGNNVGMPPGFPIPDSYGGYGSPAGPGGGYGSGGYSYGCANGACGGGYYGGYAGGYSPEADAAAQAAGYASAAAAAAATGSYGYGGYGGYGTPGTPGYGYSGAYYGGGYDPAAAAAGWPGGAYPGGVPQPYTGGSGYNEAGVYVGGDYGVGGVYYGTGDGSVGGSTTGGDGSTTTSGTTTGGSTTGGESTSGSTTGGTVGGAVIADTDKAPRGWFSNFLCKLFKMSSC